jgi:hypothetical protein
MRFINGILLSFASLVTAATGFVVDATTSGKEPPSPIGTMGEYTETSREVILVDKQSFVVASPYDARFNYPRDPKKRCPMWEPLLYEAALLPVDVFSYIAWRESGCNPEAQNAKWDANGNMTYALNKDRSYDTGLLQINSSWYSVTKLVCGDAAVENKMQGLKDPICNVNVARYIMVNSKGKLGNWRIYKD